MGFSTSPCCTSGLPVRSAAHVLISACRPVDVVDDNVRDGASDRRRAGDTCINRRSLNRSVSLVYRWTVHLAAGVDYDGLATNDEQLRKNIREYSDQINKVKSTMGLNKAAR